MEADGLTKAEFLEGELKSFGKKGSRTEWAKGSHDLANAANIRLIDEEIVSLISQMEAGSIDSPGRYRTWVKRASKINVSGMSTTVYFTRHFSADKVHGACGILPANSTPVDTSTSAPH